MVDDRDNRPTAQRQDQDVSVLFGDECRLVVRFHYRLLARWISRWRHAAIAVRRCLPWRLIWIYFERLSLVRASSATFDLTCWRPTRLCILNEAVTNLPTSGCSATQWGSAPAVRCDVTGTCAINNVTHITRNTFYGTCICPVQWHSIHRFRNIWLVIVMTLNYDDSKSSRCQSIAHGWFLIRLSLIVMIFCMWQLKTFKHWNNNIHYSTLQNHRAPAGLYSLYCMDCTTRIVQSSYLSPFSKYFDV